VEILDWAMRKCPQAILSRDQGVKIWKSYDEDLPEGFDIPPIPFFLELPHDADVPRYTTADEGPVALSRNKMDGGWDWINLEWCHRWLGE